MTEAPQRGSVVLHRGRYGVVWQVVGDGLVLHPVIQQTRARKAHDVDLTFAELIAAGIELPRGLVRCGNPVQIATAHGEFIGTITGPLVCRITAATARAYVEAETDARWSAERRHRHEAQSARPVRMVG